MPDTEVATAGARLEESGLVTVSENNTPCCYALQDKVWVHGPGNEPWEVYVVKGDAGQLAKADDSACCADASDAATTQTPAAAGQPLPVVAAASGSSCC